LGDVGAGQIALRVELLVHRVHVADVAAEIVLPGDRRRAADLRQIAEAGHAVRRVPGDDRVLQQAAARGVALVDAVARHVVTVARHKIQEALRPRATRTRLSESVPPSPLATSLAYIVCLSQAGTHLIVFKFLEGCPLPR